MPLIAIALLATLALVLPGGVAAASPDRDRWRRPLQGPVVGSFSFDPAAPFERGRRRGIDVGGRPGAPVVAACAGVVTHAGAVPGWGAGVTLRCGRLVATELGLARVSVVRGDAVRRGALIGTLRRQRILRLGARREGLRHGYVDPASLLGDDRPWGGAPAAPPVPRRRSPPSAVPAGWVAASPGEPAASRSAVPRAAWIGLALVAGGAGGASGAAQRRRRRPRRRAEVAGAHR